MNRTAIEVVLSAIAALVWLFVCVTIVRADEPSPQAALPDVKSEKFTVIEKSDAALVAMSVPHQDSKDVRSVYLLIVYAEVGPSGTRAVLSHAEVNCTLSRIKWSVAYRLSGDTAVLGTLNPKTPDWQQINPESPSGDVYEHVCGHPVTPSQEAST